MLSNRRADRPIGCRPFETEETRLRQQARTVREGRIPVPGSQTLDHEENDCVL